MTDQPLRPYCNACGWRKGGPDSWNGVACKCGFTALPINRLVAIDRTYYETPGELYAVLESMGYRRGGKYPWEWQYGLCEARVDYRPGHGYYFIERA